MSESVGIDPQVRSRGEVIPERNTVVPPWAPPIKDFSVRVKVRVGDYLNEVPPGFTIGEVAPEYRWAIDPDTGIVMDQPTFKMQYEKWYAAHYAMQNPPQAVEGSPLSIPHVLDFVTMKVHPNDQTKVIPMSTNLDRPVTLNPPLLYDQHGENPLTPEQVDAQKNKIDATARMEELLNLQADGDITQEVFVRRAKEIFGGSVVVGDDGADSSESVTAGSPPPGFEPRPESPPKPTNFPVDPPAPKETGPEMASALCGKEVKKKGVHVHERQCKECKALKEPPQEE